jgi:hypothetical protein
MGVCEWINLAQDNEDITYLHGTPKVHYSVHKILPLGLIQNMMNPARSPTACFSKINFNITLPLLLGLASVFRREGTTQKT